MALDCCVLPPEPAAGVFGATHAHGLRVEDVDLEEIAGCQFKFHHCCTLLSFKVHPSVIWVILTVIPLIWHIDTIDVTTYIGRLFSS